MAAGTFIPGSATGGGSFDNLRRPRRDDFPAQGAYDQAMIEYGGASAGKPTIEHTPSQFVPDADFNEKLKEQLAEAGGDFDKADQPFMALSPARIGNARIQPAEMRSMVPSIANIRGTPTGVSYNPYIAQKKRTA